MIVIMLVFIILVFLWTRKQRKHPSTPFLFGMALAWTVAFLALLLIVGNQSLLFMVQHELFPFDWFVFSRFPAVHSRPDVLVTFLNVGVAVFYYSFVAFAISNTRSNQLQNYYYLMWVALPLAFSVVVFDPRFIRFLSGFYAAHSSTEALSLTKALHSLRLAFSVIHVLYFATGVVILLHHTWLRPRLRKVQRSIEMMNLTVILFGATFVFFFAYQPELLVIPTLVPPYTRIAFIDLSSVFPFFRFLPGFQVAVLSLFGLSIVHYLKIMSADVISERRIRNAFHIASLGSRVIGHSMKNRLLAIESQIDLIQRDFSEASPELHSRLLEVAEMCRHSYKGIDRSTSLLTRPTLNLKPDHVHDVIPIVIKDFEQHNRRLNISYEQEAVYTRVFLDRFHFSEAILNILRNALQATEAQHLQKIHVTVTGDTRWVNVHVRDNGPGLEEQDLENIFQPFYSRKNSQTNWGLGLAYCHYIIEAHDGKIGLHNLVAGGAEALISLPLA